MRAEGFDIDELVNNLNGSCSTINDELPLGMSEEDLTKAEEDQIKDQIFRCCECGYWHPVDEKEKDDFGDNVCSDCFFY